jgi:predicted RNA-binding Zn-ribbon protein involved in translation (DUF1610 family)
MAEKADWYIPEAKQPVITCPRCGATDKWERSTLNGYRCGSCGMWQGPEAAHPDGDGS